MSSGLRGTLSQPFVAVQYIPLTHRINNHYWHLLLSLEALEITFYMEKWETHKHNAYLKSKIGNFGA